MRKKLQVTLVLLIALSTILSFVILLAPKTSQKLINSWFENGHEKSGSQQIASPNHEIRVLGPAQSSSNPGQ
jgi:hypothetical protein